MKYLPLIKMGFIFFAGGLFLLIAGTRPGLGWVPYMQMSIGLTAIFVKLVWVFRHRQEYKS